AYIADGKDIAYEYAYISDLRRKGISVEKRFGEDKDALIAYCKRCGISRALVLEGRQLKEIEVG
ncbi:MAG: hypothetical protein K2L51_06330, partial [Clostridiales bacterium]|nr:hypothetical protein [Clostridiales bacterium]